MYKILLLSLWICFATTNAIHGQQSREIISTTYGKVAGSLSTDGKVKVFKGIPFAAPPIGTLRWKKPMPPIPWKDVKVCTTFSASPMQPKPAPFFVWSEEYLIPSEPISEDCLYLNVWTSNKNTSTKKPVLVWIYGGGFTSGGSACPIYDGEAFAREDVVFVSLNYRVGIFGFFAHPDINMNNDGVGSGNFGILDQIAGLHWVKENIAAFGGDPNNVTIAGQSAGSMSVNCLVASPLAKGLFTKAIAQSGSNFTRGNLSKEQAVQASEIYAKSLGKSSIEELRGISAEELLKRNSSMRGPYIDGVVLPQHILDIFQEGKENKVTLLTGWNQDEGMILGKPKDAMQYVNDIKVQYKEDADQLLKYYPATSDENAVKSQVYISRDQVFGIQNFTWGNISSRNGSKVFVYRFTRLVPENKTGSKYSAFHTGEVPYAYNNLKFVNRPFQEEDHRLATTMSCFWINFIKRGDPNEKGLPAWPSYHEEDKSIMIFDTESRVSKLQDGEALKFLHSITTKSK